jgi:hypothetical protein
LGRKFHRRRAAQPDSSEGGRIGLRGEKTTADRGFLTPDPEGIAARNTQRILHAFQGQFRIERNDLYKLIADQFILIRCRPADSRQQNRR